MRGFVNAVSRLFSRLQQALHQAMGSANGPFGSADWRKGQEPRENPARSPDD